MKHRNTILIVLCLSVTLACGLTSESAKRKYLDRGNKFFEQGKYADASLNYRKALQNDPRFGEGYFRLGLSELKQDNVNAAYEALSRAVEFQPDNMEANLALAQIALTTYIADSRRPRNLYDLLTKLSAKFLARDPNSIDGLRIKAALALTDMRAAEALELYRKANKLKPLQKEIVLPFVQVLGQQGQLQEAEKLALEFIQADKTYGPMYDVLYSQYMTSKRVADAEHILKIKAQNNPDVPGYVTQLAGHYASSGNQTEMLNTLRPLIDNQNRFPLVRLQLGDFYARIGNQDQARQYFEEGLKAEPKEKSTYQKRILNLLVAQGKKAEALQMAMRILGEGPKEDDIRVMYSLLLLESGTPANIDRALSELQAMLNQRPQDASLQHHLARAYMAKGNLNAALTNLREAIKKDPANLNSRLLLADINLQKNRYQEAQEQVTEILARDPQNALGRLFQAASQTGLGHYAAANAELLKLGKELPDSPEPKLYLASLKMAQKNFNEAESILRSMYRPGKADLRPLQALVQNYYAQNRYDKAIELLSNDWQKSSNPDVQSMLADASLRARQFDRAIAEYQKLTTANPKSSFHHMRLGDAYLQKGSIEEAIPHLRRAQELAPQDALANAILALALHNAGRSADAKQFYKQAINLKSDDPLVNNNLAYLMAETGDNLDEALRLAQTAHQAMPEESAISDTVGWIYLKKNMVDSALQIFSNNIRTAPKHPVYRYHLGMALFQKGQKAKAKTELQAALTASPSSQDASKIRELLAQIPY